MNNTQSGILESTPPVARYLIFSLTDQGEARQSLRVLRNMADGRETVVGLGQSLVLALGASVPGLRTALSYTGAGFEVPSTPFALWCWLRGDDRGELLHRARRINTALAPAFRVLRRFRGRLEADGRRGGRDSRRLVHLHPSDIWRLFLVPRHTRRTIGSPTAWRVNVQLGRVCAVLVP